MASIGAAVLLVGGTFAAWAVTDNANPIGVKVTPGTLTDDDTKYVTLDWGENTSISNVTEIKVAENRKVGVIELLTDGHAYTGDLKVSIKSETTDKAEGVAYLKDYLAVSVYYGQKDLVEGALPTSDDQLMQIEAQYKTEAASRVYEKTSDAEGAKIAVEGQEGEYEGKYYTVFVTLDNGASPVYSEIKEDVVFLSLDWNAKSGDVATSKTVYVTRPSDWAGDDTYAYAWKGELHNAEWPGIEMNEYRGDIFSAEIPNSFDSLVFNNGLEGEDKEQTKDLSLENFDVTKPCYDIENDAWIAIPEQQDLEYKIVGTIYGEDCWAYADGLELTRTQAEAEEYTVQVEFKAGDEIKALDNYGKWYPESGDNYKITEAGTYDIYFRPAGNSDWGYYFLYLAKATTEDKVVLMGVPDWTDGTEMTLKSVQEGEPHEYEVTLSGLTLESEFKIKAYIGGVTTWYGFDSVKAGCASLVKESAENSNIMVNEAGDYKVYFDLVADDAGDRIWVAAAE